jgi:poly(3-hydroxybutyrate) depolymerase
MGPTSPLIVGGLLALSVAAMVGLVRFRWLAVRIGCGALTLVLSMGSGLVLVNDYYGYYRTWGDLAHDLSNSTPHTLLAGGVPKNNRVVVHSGEVVSFNFDGSASGITRAGLIYLPPQYRESAFRNVRFPVLELLHGYPGRPSDWIYALHLTSIVDREIALRRLGPMVMVMPAVSSGNSAQECVNSARAQDDTFLTTDVRSDIVGHFRVSSDPAEWGLMGFSSGGYCAANLAMRHRSMFGSAASLDGYYQAVDGPAAKVLGQDPALVAANSPVTEASQLNSGSLPIPSFWLSVGTGNADDQRQAKLFASTMSPVENVTLVTLPKQGHNFYAWQAVLPTALNWSWQQLSPPDLRVLFPVSGTSSVLDTPLPPPAKGRYRRPGTLRVLPPRLPSSTPTRSTTAPRTVSPATRTPGTVPPTAAG